MPPLIKSGPPLVITVANGRYEMYGPPTPRSELLAVLLEKLGGISDIVADGCYHFNAELVNDELQVTLTLFEE